MHLLWEDHSKIDYCDKQGDIWSQNEGWPEQSHIPINWFVGSCDDIVGWSVPDRRGPWEGQITTVGAEKHDNSWPQLVQHQESVGPWGQVHGQWMAIVDPGCYVQGVRQTWYRQHSEYDAEASVQGLRHGPLVMEIESKITYPGMQRPTDHRRLDIGPTNWNEIWISV